MAKAKSGESRAADVIKNWLRNRSTLEFLGTWETLYNPDFKVVEFDHFKMQAGLPTLINELTVMSNLETYNAELIKSGKSKADRFEVLLGIERYQLTVLDEAEKMRDTKKLLDTK